MIQVTVRILFTISLFTICAGAMAPPNHSICSYKPIALRDAQTGTNYSSSSSTITSGNAGASWTQNTRNGYFRALAIAGGHSYDFTLVGISSSAPNMITGLWDITRDGATVCKGCVGRAYGLNSPVGNGLQDLRRRSQLLRRKLALQRGYYQSV